MHRVQGGAVLKRQRQVQHPGAHFHVVHGADRFFTLQQRLHQAGLIQQARVIVHLEAAHARGQFQDAGHRLVFKVFHQRVHAQPQGQIQHVVAVLDQDVFVAGLAVGDARHMAVRVQLGDHGGGGERRIGRVVEIRRHRRHRRQLFDSRVLGLFQRQGLGEGDGREADAVAGLELAHFPQLRLGDGHRADETAQAGAVLGEDHREVAGEVD